MAARRPGHRQDGNAVLAHQDRRPREEAGAPQSARAWQPLRSLVQGASFFYQKYLSLPDCLQSNPRPAVFPEAASGFATQIFQGQGGEASGPAYPICFYSIYPELPDCWPGLPFEAGAVPDRRRKRCLLAGLVLEMSRAGGGEVPARRLKRSRAVFNNVLSCRIAARPDRRDRSAGLPA